MRVSGAGAGAERGADLRHVDTWIFDLDNTLYTGGELFLSLIGDRMTAYVERVTGLDTEGAHALQKRYLVEQGATLAGLVAFHGVDARHFLDDVHEVSLDSLTPDPRLARAIAHLSGRRLVFTNGSAGHAERVLAHLGLAELFEHVFHLEAAALTPKPQARAYEALIAAHGVTPKTSAFFEDTERNLAPAYGYGMTTVLVGPHAAASTADFVDYRTESLVTFLEQAQVRASRQPRTLSKASSA